jgi:hypothetical protein
VLAEGVTINKPGTARRRVREAAMRLVATGLVITLVVIGCTSGVGESTTPADEITANFDGGTCTYSGPDRVLAGEPTVNLDVEDQMAHDSYGLAVLTLDEGKTFKDLEEWPHIWHPPWSREEGLIRNVPQGTRAELTVDASRGHSSWCASRRIPWREPASWAGLRLPTRLGVGVRECPEWVSPPRDPTARPALGAHDPARIVYLAATESAVGVLQVTDAEIRATMEAKGYPESQIADFLRIVEIAREAPAVRLGLLEQFLTDKVQGLGNDAQ